MKKKTEKTPTYFRCQRKELNHFLFYVALNYLFVGRFHVYKQKQ